MDENINEEKIAIAQLAEGYCWSDFIPAEWIDIYNVYFEETKNTPLPEREIVKIDKDVPRTFGLFVRNARLLRLNFPANLQPYFDGLREVLIAVSRDRGYCQGLNFIAATILLQTQNVQKAAVILNFLLKHRKLEILFDPKYSALMDYMRIFEKRLRKFVPKVYKHFKKCEFTTVSYAIEWFTTCFIVTSPGELSYCVLDLLIAGFEDIMIRVGLGLLRVLEEKLLRLDFEGLHQQFKHLVMTLDPYEIMVQALPIVVPRQTSLLEGMSLKIDALGPASNGNLKFSSSGGINLHHHHHHHHHPLDAVEPAGSGLSSEHSHEEKSGCSYYSDFDQNKARNDQRAPSTSPRYKLISKMKHKLKSDIKSLSKRAKNHIRKVPKTAHVVNGPSDVQSGLPTVPLSASETATTVPPSLSVGVQVPSSSTSKGKRAAEGGNAITTWWNVTWKNALFYQVPEQPLSPPSVPVSSSPSKPTSPMTRTLNNSVGMANPVLSSSSNPRVGLSVGNGSELSNPTIWKNQHISPIPALVTSPKAGVIINLHNHSRYCTSTSQGDNYDGDTETDEYMVKSVTEGCKSPAGSSEGKCEADKASPATSPHPAATRGAESDAIDSHPSKRRHKLLLLEHAYQRFEEKNMEDTYVDQGGEILDEARGALHETPVVGNFRIALALDALQENWFPARPPKQKTSLNNMKVRSQHKRRKPKEIEQLMLSALNASQNARGRPNADATERDDVNI
jgi:hypothetical protein